MTNTNTAINANNIASIDCDYTATVRRQSWSQTRAIERRIVDATPIWLDGDNGDREPWDWIRGEYTAVYCLPKYGYIVYHRTGAGGSEAVETEDGGYVGGSSLYAVNPWAINALIGSRANAPRWDGVADFLKFETCKLVHSHN